MLVLNQVLSIAPVDSIIKALMEGRTLYREKKNGVISTRSLLVWPYSPAVTIILAPLLCLDNLLSYKTSISGTVRHAIEFPELTILYYPFSIHRYRLHASRIQLNPIPIGDYLPPLFGWTQINKDSLPQRATPLMYYLSSLNAICIAMKRGQTSWVKGQKAKKLSENPSDFFPTLASFPVIATIQDPVDSENPEIVCNYDLWMQKARRLNWQKECSLKQACDFEATPFLIVGISAKDDFRRILGRTEIKPKGQRQINLVLIDLSYRAWANTKQDPLKTCKNLLAELYKNYEDARPPALVITDVAYRHMQMVKNILPLYAKGSKITRKGMRRSPASVCLSFNRDLSKKPNQKIIQPISESAGIERIAVRVIGQDYASLQERLVSYSDYLDENIGDRYGRILRSLAYRIRQLSFLPGNIVDYSHYLDEVYLPTRAKILKSKIGLDKARALLSEMKNRFRAYERILQSFHEEIARVSKSLYEMPPGQTILEELLNELAGEPSNSLLVYSKQDHAEFIDWQIRHELISEGIANLSGKRVNILSSNYLRNTIGTGIKIRRVVLLGPTPEDIVSTVDLAVDKGYGFKELRIIGDSAHLRIALKVIGYVVFAEGTDPKLRETLKAIADKLKESIGGAIQFPHIKEQTKPEILDLTVVGSSHEIRDEYGGPLYSIYMDDGLQIEAHERSELLKVDDIDGSLKKVFAKDLKIGQSLCVVYPTDLHQLRILIDPGAAAPDLLRTYHKYVSDRVQDKFEGDLSEAARNIRNKIRQIDQRLSLPEIQTIRNWIDVSNLSRIPATKVRPQAPRHFNMFKAFMKILGADDTLIRHFWQFAIAWTRGRRIGQALQWHQTLLATLADPAAAKRIYPDVADEIANLQKYIPDMTSTISEIKIQQYKS